MTRLQVSAIKFALTAGLLSFLLVVPPAFAESARRACSNDPNALTKNDVRTIVKQAVVQAEASGVRAVIAVVDREANVLALFRMNGADSNLRIPFPSPLNGFNPENRLPVSPDLPFNAQELAAITKAGTGAYLSSQGHAFSTRTASFIVQKHFPPQVEFTPGGPLFGVQFSQLGGIGIRLNGTPLTFCGDINSTLPFGLAADPGGLPLYKNGVITGGVGIEADGAYTADLDPTDFDVPVEELIAVAAARGYEPSPAIRGEEIVVNGISFPYLNASTPPPLPLPGFRQLDGTLNPVSGRVKCSAPFSFRTIQLEDVTVRVREKFFPFRASNDLTVEEVTRILVQAIRQANKTRAAIRRPINTPAEVNVAVVDVEGRVLGLVSTPDAPLFGLDVSVQKARTSAFFSKATAGDELRQAGFAEFVERAARDGIQLNGSVAFSSRAIGFLERPFLPDGIDGSQAGPFSVDDEEFSPFNVGLQLDLLVPALARILSGTAEISLDTSCTGIASLANGIQIFPGSVPLYKGRQLVGAIGVSGDGVDQDDIVAAMGSAGFEAPVEIRSDRIFVRGVRLPYVKFPRHPNL